MAARALKYAAYIAICCVIVRKIDHMVKKCMEPPDDWDIHTECTGTEVAAGYLRKKGKGVSVWTKRYIVIDKKKLIYYADQLRTVIKGEIVIAGALAENCRDRADEETKFFFNISHPVCGTREFYAKSDARRRQWINSVNTISAQLILGSCYGVLFKLGGLTGKTWQERWCVCAGETLDYFDGPTSNHSKGGLSIKGAEVRHVKRPDQNYCFEVEADALTATVKKSFFGGAKANKVYVFASPTQAECERWVDVLSAAAVIVVEPEVVIGPDGVEMTMTANPMNASVAGVGALFVKEVVWPEKSGILGKKSNATFTLSSWQDRWFSFNKEHKALIYHKEKGSEEKGRILLAAIIIQKGIIQDRDDPTIFRFYVRPNNRKYELRAPSGDECTVWVEMILKWLELYQSGKKEAPSPDSGTSPSPENADTAEKDKK